MTAEEAAGAQHEVWPELLEAVEVFGAIRTQWRTGMNGPTGLDYAAIPVALEMIGIERSAWAQMFEDLRVMESAALAHIQGW